MAKFIGSTWTAKNGKRDAAYKLYGDGVPAGWIENHRDGRGLELWRADDGRELSSAEAAEHKTRVEAARRDRDAEQERQRAAAAAQADVEWAKAKPAPASHEYLKRKAIKPHNLREIGGDLLAPLRNAKGRIQTHQRISPRGEKRLLAGGAKTGNFYAVGKPRDGVLCIAEGVATGLSIHQATGHAVAAAIDCGNLLPVAKVLRAKHPSMTILICGDDDIGTDGNPGATKAAEAAAAVNGTVVLPDFGENRPDGVTDFNDLMLAQGPDAVRRCIEAAQTSVRVHDAVRLVRGSDLTPVPISWLWRYWLALGKFHILAGPPGSGKTTIAIALVATVTSGGRFPDGTRCPPRSVLIWSGEDDISDTLGPRLIAAGADMTRVYFVTGTRQGEEVVPFDPARDLVQLTAQAHRIGEVGLLVVDPVVSAVAGDSHKNTEVRRALQPLVDLASFLNAAVLGITHFSKGTGGRDPTERVTGSVAFGAVARIVMCAAKVKTEDGERRIFARAKSNIGPDDGGFEYSLDQVEAVSGIQASMVMWGQSLEGAARELLADVEDDADRDESSARSGAETFLAELLKTPTPAKTVRSEATEAGHSWSTIRRAADDLKVVRKKTAEAWVWSLPTKVLIKVLTPKHEHLEHVEHLDQAKMLKVPKALTSHGEHVDEHLAEQGVGDDPSSSSEVFEA